MREVFYALQRGISRILLLLVVGILFIFLGETFPIIFGELGAPLLRGFGLCFVGLAVGDLGLRILQPYVDTAKCSQDALKNNSTSAALIYLGRCILAGIILMLIVTASRADSMPLNAIKYSPLMIQELDGYWPALKLRSLLASQIEQETCISLKSKTCWSNLAELHTSREQGVGFGQTTRAFDSKGNVRFDTLKELTLKYPKELKGWSWDNWQDPTLQMRALVLMVKQLNNNIKLAATEIDQYAFAMSAYNGGNTGLSNDRLSCKAIDNCNPNIWFNNVEFSSMKSKTIIPGYGGQSPYSINRTYVKNIVFVRRNKYLTLDVA